MQILHDTFLQPHRSLKTQHEDKQDNGFCEFDHLQIDYMSD